MATSFVQLVPPGSQKSIYRQTYDVTATADADTVVTVNHSVSLKPGDTASKVLAVWLEPILPEYYASRWVIVSRNATSVVIQKQNTLASGAATAQLRIHILRIHSVTD